MIEDKKFFLENFNEQDLEIVYKLFFCIFHYNSYRLNLKIVIQMKLAKSY